MDFPFRGILRQYTQNMGAPLSGNVTAQKNDQFPYQAPSGGDWGCMQEKCRFVSIKGESAAF